VVVCLVTLHTFVQERTLDNSDVPRRQEPQLPGIRERR
jgi:hypothetical protein